MFADDTALFFSSKIPNEVQQKLNNDVKSISECLEGNGLVLNLTKSEVMLIGSTQTLRNYQPIQLYLCDIIIKKVDTSKYFRVKVGPSLNWSSHIDSLGEKVSS